MDIKERIPFSSSRKCSKIVCDNETFALGALEYINGESINKYDSYLLKYIEQGYRIISLISLSVTVIYLNKYFSSFQHPWTYNLLIGK